MLHDRHGGFDLKNQCALALLIERAAHARYLKYYHRRTDGDRDRDQEA
jgi:hypothetical protein